MTWRAKRRVSLWQAVTVLGGTIAFRHWLIFSPILRLRGTFRCLAASVTASCRSNTSALGRCRSCLKKAILSAVVARSGVIRGAVFVGVEKVDDARAGDLPPVESSAPNLAEKALPLEKLGDTERAVSTSLEEGGIAPERQQ